jgi:hypothetical protein
MVGECGVGSQSVERKGREQSKQQQSCEGRHSPPKGVVLLKKCRPTAPLILNMQVSANLALRLLYPRYIINRRLGASPDIVVRTFLATLGMEPWTVQSVTWYPGSVTCLYLDLTAAIIPR